MRQAVRTLGIQGQPPQQLTPGWGPGPYQATRLGGSRSPEPSSHEGPLLPRNMRPGLGELGLGETGA